MPTRDGRRTRQDDDLRAGLAAPLLPTASELATGFALIAAAAVSVAGVFAGGLAVDLIARGDAADGALLASAAALTAWAVAAALALLASMDAKLQRLLARGAG